MGSTRETGPSATLFYDFGTPPVSGTYALGTGQEDFDLLLRKYGNSTTWVYVAINRIANAAAQIPLLIVRTAKKGQPGAVDTGPAAGLRALIERPNDFQSYFDFVETSFVSLESTGNLYILKDELNGFGRPRRLYILDPSKITPIPDQKNLIGGYKYKIGNKEREYKPLEVVHIKYANAHHPHLGFAPLTAARLSIATDLASVGWNQQFLDHGAWPAGAITTPNDVSAETRRRLGRQIKKMVQGGKRGVAQVLLLTGGMDYKAIAMNPKDLDWLDARRMSRDEILAIFGVPGAVAGLFSQESTTARSAGVAQQVKNFYLFTIFPKMVKFAAALSYGLAAAYPGNKELQPNLMAVPALADDVEKELKLAQTFRTLQASGWPLNSILAQYYPQVPRFPHGDAAWFNAAMIPITGPENPVAGAGESLGDPDAGGNVPTDPSASEPTPKHAAEIRARTGLNSGGEHAAARLLSRYGERL